MLHMKSSNCTPVRFIEAGNLISTDVFLHKTRCLQFFVLLVGVEGTLYISQDDVEYTLEPGKFILLLPDHVHKGARPTRGKLSYYWAHFTLGEAYQLLEDQEAEQYLKCMSADANRDVFLLPTSGTFDNASRIMLEFRQLIDFSMQNVYSASMPGFALSILLMDLTHEYIQKNQQQIIDQSACSMQDLQKYIQVNYDSNLSVSHLATLFGYNPNYLSSAYKKSTGISLVHYINQTRISVAKSLLLDTNDSVSAIAAKVGYSDSKYFIRVFRQYTKMTPTMFRNVYFRKYINRE